MRQNKSHLLFRDSSEHFLLFSLVTASYAQAAQLPQLVIDRDESFKAAIDLKIPDLKRIFEDFEYPEGATPRAFLYDFNGDNIYEILIQSYQSLCGTGGCEYILIDGKSKRKICDLFGNPIVVLQKMKGQHFPDIQTFVHTGSGTGILDTFSYSKGKYKSGTSIKLSDRGSGKYLKMLEKVPVSKSN